MYYYREFALSGRRYRVQFPTGALIKIDFKSNNVADAIIF